VLVPSLEPVTPATVTATPRRITLEGSRLFDPNGESVTLIGDVVEVPSDDYLDPPGGDKSPRGFRVELPDEVGPGNYAVRVRVNDAESLEPREVQVT
jgi:methionine-rich copper-binding protein CopC